VVYLAAIWSMATQIEGLIGANGILPIQDQLDRIGCCTPKKNTGNPQRFSG
jgi:hypothetical protein